MDEEATWSARAAVALEQGDRELATALHRQHYVEAGVLAVDSWHRVLTLIGAAEDEEAARRALVLDLGIDEAQAEYVLGLPFTTLCQRARRERRDSLAQLRAVTEREV